MKSTGISCKAFSIVMERHPFTMDAICLLPDHLHCIWTMPEDNADYSLRWKEIKRYFTRKYVKHSATTVHPHKIESRQNRREANIWQRRFWEHAIRDETDLERHLDYIHYNPVKHGFVENVIDWKWSSFHRFVKMGFYEKGWGKNAGKIIARMNCGE